MTEVASKPVKAPKAPKAPKPPKVTKAEKAAAMRALKSPPRLPGGPSIADLRNAIAGAERDGIARDEMVLRLTYRDDTLIKRSPSVDVGEVSFADGVMRFLGVRVVTGAVVVSTLDALTEADVAATH